MTSATFADLVSLIPALVAAFAIVTGSAVLITVWQSFRRRTPFRHRRGVQVHPQDTAGQNPEDAL